MRAFKVRAAIGSVAVALLALALVAPTAMAAPGNGGGNGRGHGKPAETGASRGQGHESKSQKKAKPDKKAKSDKKAEKKAKPDKGSKADPVGGDDDAGDTQESPVAPAKPRGGPNFLAMLACKDGGWQTLQRADGTPFDNQGRCVSHAVRGGVLVPVAPDDGDDAVPDDAVADADQQGGANHLAMLPCKDGGWQTLQRADGTRFDNQGRCVSYAVQDGVLVPVVPVITISFVPTTDLDGSCDATAALGDFDPSADYVGTFVVDGTEEDLDPITTDALGDASVPLGTFTTGQMLVLTVDGVTSDEIPVACPPVIVAP